MDDDIRDFVRLIFLAVAAAVLAFMVLGCCRVPLPSYAVDRQEFCRRLNSF